MNYASIFNGILVSEQASILVPEPADDTEKLFEADDIGEEEPEPHKIVCVYLDVSLLNNTQTMLKEANFEYKMNAYKTHPETGESVLLRGFSRETVGLILINTVLCSYPGICCPPPKDEEEEAPPPGPAPKQAKRRFPPKKPEINLAAMSNPTFIHSSGKLAYRTQMYVEPVTIRRQERNDEIVGWNFFFRYNDPAMELGTGIKRYLELLKATKNKKHRVIPGYLDLLNKIDDYRTFLEEFVSPLCGFELQQDIARFANSDINPNDDVRSFTMDNCLTMNRLHRLLVSYGLRTADDYQDGQFAERAMLIDPFCVNLVKVWNSSLAVFPVDEDPSLAIPETMLQRAKMLKFDSLVSLDDKDPSDVIKGINQKELQGLSPLETRKMRESERFAARFGKVVNCTENPGYTAVLDFVKAHQNDDIPSNPYEPYDTELSIFANTQIRTMMLLERLREIGMIAYHIETLQQLEVRSGVFYRWEPSEYGFCHIVVQGPPGCGKSYIHDLFKQFSIPGTFREINYETARAYTGNTNDNHLVLIFDEIPERFQETGDGSGHADVKVRMSAPESHSIVMQMETIMDLQGNQRTGRNAVKCIAKHMCMLFFNTNTLNLPEPIMDRIYFHVVKFFERRRSRLGELSPDDAMAADAFREEMKWLQALACVTCMKINVGQLPPVNMQVAHCVLERIETILSKEGIPLNLRIRNRALKCIHSKTLNYAIRRVFLLRDSRRKFSYDLFKELPPYLFATEDIVLFSLSLMEDAFYETNESLLFRAIYHSCRHQSIYEKTHGKGTDDATIQYAVGEPKYKYWRTKKADALEMEDRTDFVFLPAPEKVISTREIVTGIARELQAEMRRLKIPALSSEKITGMLLSLTNRVAKGEEIISVGQQHSRQGLVISIAYMKSVLESKYESKWAEVMEKYKYKYMVPRRIVLGKTYRDTTQEEIQKLFTTPLPKYAPSALIMPQFLQVMKLEEGDEVLQLENTQRKLKGDQITFSLAPAAQPGDQASKAAYISFHHNYQDVVYEEHLKTIGFDVETQKALYPDIEPVVYKLDYGGNPGMDVYPRDYMADFLKGYEVGEKKEEEETTSETPAKHVHVTTQSFMNE